MSKIDVALIRATAHRNDSTETEGIRPTLEQIKAKVERAIEDAYLEAGASVEVNASAEWTD